MAYSTATMVRRALAPSLTDPSGPPPAGEETNTAADLSNDELNDAIAEADAQIDSYLGARYAVPVASDSGGATPHPLDFWSRNIAAYNATLAYRGSLDFSDNDPVARRWRATMDALAAVRDGKATLPFAAVDATSPGSGGGADDAINPYVGELFGQQFADELLTGPATRGYAFDGHWYDGWGRAW